MTGSGEHIVEVLPAGTNLAGSTARGCWVWLDYGLSFLLVDTAIAYSRERRPIAMGAIRNQRENVPDTCQPQAQLTPAEMRATSQARVWLLSRPYFRHIP